MSQTALPADAPEGAPMPASHEPPFALRPDAARVFADRARRFATLAEGHAQGDWLRFLAELTDRQHRALSALVEAELPLPDATALERARQHAMPPLSVAGWPRDAAWQHTLRRLLDGLHAFLPAQAQAILQRLQQDSPSELESLADALLNYRLAGEADRAAAVFVAAALQVYWTAMAVRLDASQLVRLDSKNLCPCCGSLPVASVVRVAGTTTPGRGGAAAETTSGVGEAVANLRYLHCALCNTEWNLVRVSCVHCDDNGKVAYQSLQGHASAVRAETCDVCHSYLKILYQEKDPQADPVADDLATLALDLLLDDAGYQRCGPNLLLLAGEAT